MPIWTPCVICGQPRSATDHDGGCPVTVAGLVRRYGSEGTAAGAIALGIEQVPTAAWTKFPESFRSLVLFKQQMAVLKLTAIAAGTSLERLQRLWHEQAATGATT